MKKLLAVLLTMSILIACTMFHTSALGTNSLGTEKEKPTTIIQVDGVYNADPEYERMVKQKQQIAENYYQAVTNNDFEKASQYKSEFEQFTNPVLYQRQQVELATSQNSVRSYPESWSIPNFAPVPQENYYYCGPATAKSILDSMGINRTQTQLAGTNYLKTTPENGTPWYMTNGNDYSQFPMPNTLTDIQYEVSDSAYMYVASPTGAAGANPLTVEQCKAYVMSTVSVFGFGYGVAANGRSDKDVDDPSHLPGYPTNEDIKHWVAVDGYYDNGNMIWIADPAKSSAVGWSNSIQSYCIVSAENFCAFVAHRGIVW